MNPRAWEDDKHYLGWRRRKRFLWIIRFSYTKPLSDISTTLIGLMNLFNSSGCARVLSTSAGKEISEPIYLAWLQQLDLHSGFADATNKENQRHWDLRRCLHVYSFINVIIPPDGVIFAFLSTTSKDWGDGCDFWVLLVELVSDWVFDFFHPRFRLRGGIRTNVWICRQKR